MQDTQREVRKVGVWFLKQRKPWGRAGLWERDKLPLVTLLNRGLLLPNDSSARWAKQTRPRGLGQSCCQGHTDTGTSDPAQWKWRPRHPEAGGVLLHCDGANLGSLSGPSR